MTLTYILMIWTVVAMNSSYAKYDWKPLGEFSSEQLCQAAAKELGIPDKTYRCVRSK